MLSVEQQNKNKEEFLTLLDSIENKKGLQDLITFLKESDFFIAPASTSHHGNYEGGLCEHVLNVYKKFLELSTHHEISNSSMIIVSLLHDFCKINYYYKTTKWRKDENNKWESYEAYKVDDLHPLGHGEKSVILLQRFIELNDLETYLIRFHMGAFGLDFQGLRTYNNAVEKYPLIVMFHCSDYLATTFMDGKDEK